MGERQFQVVVIGAGPGGYVAAIRAAQLGLKVAVVEREAPGGVCLNLGCIPSKALIRQAELFREGKKAMERAGVRLDFSSFNYAAVWKESRNAAERLSKGVRFLLKKNGVEYIEGRASLETARRVRVESAAGGETLAAQALILATGSRPRPIPGFAFDEKRILSSTGLLLSDSLPKRLAVLGAGAIGMEMAYVMRAFGVEVEVIELMDRVLPLEDAESAELVARAFKSLGIRLHTSLAASSHEERGEGLLLKLKSAPSLEGAAAAESELETDRVLVAVGRAPNTEGLGLEGLGVRLNRGFVEIGDYQESSVEGVYAIGDIVASPQLAHVASKEGEIAAERVAQVLMGAPPPKERRVDPLLVPSAVYCEPELGSFGLQEARAKALGRPYGVARFPYRGIGKAVALGAPEGQVKILYDPGTEALLGASVVGIAATEIIHELLLAARAELLLEDVADMIHAHPTISEGVMEGARAGLGRAIHA